MNFRVPLNAENSLTGWGTVNFTKTYDSHLQCCILSMFWRKGTGFFPQTG